MVTIVTIGERVHSPYPERRKFYVFSTDPYEETLDALRAWRLRLMGDAPQAVSKALIPLARGSMVDNKMRVVTLSEMELELSITTNRHWGQYVFRSDGNVAAFVDGQGLVLSGDEARAAKAYAAQRITELLWALTGNNPDVNVFFNGRPAKLLAALYD